MNAPIFAAYARHYDAFYRDKNYPAEAAFVDGLLRGAGAMGSLLDVGCGTGGHVREFAVLGWRASGVDLSPAMIELARARTPSACGVDYSVGAAGDFRLGRQFGAVVSLFHVVSYQAGPGDPERMFANVRRHLGPGGVFVFDFWHGPGVLADPPERRVQQCEHDGLRLTRTAQPAHFPGRSLVEVNYELVVENSAGECSERIQEQHRMRYFFLEELEPMLRATGFTIVRSHAGLTADALYPHAWHGLVVALAR